MSEQSENSSLNLGEIPPTFFSGTGRLEEVVTTRNGNQLRYERGSDGLLIEDCANPDYRFSARVFTEKGKRVIMFSINTRNSTRSDATKNFKHPDIHPSQLFGQALTYFDSLQSIDVIKGLWYATYKGGNSVNYDEYHANLTALGKSSEEISLDERKTAAYATWTGGEASKYGFKRITYIDDTNPDQVVVSFEKPKKGIISSLLRRYRGSRGRKPERLP